MPPRAAAYEGKSGVSNRPKGRIKLSSSFLNAAGCQFCRFIGKGHIFGPVSVDNSYIDMGESARDSVIEIYKCGYISPNFLHL